jgi:hypothetical protein
MTKFQILNKSQFSNHKNFKLLGAWCLVLGICLVFDAWILVIPAKAQSLSLSLWPPVLEAMIMPGKSITQAYTITNSGLDTVIDTQIMRFEPSDEFGNVTLRGLTSDEVRPLFSFENANLSLGIPFRLKSGDSEQVILKITIPEDCLEDDYYFTFLFSTPPAAKIGQSVSREAGTIGANLLLTVSKDGQPLRKGEIAEFILSRCQKLPFFNFCLLDSLDPVEFILRINNTGQAFWKPFGKVKINGLLKQSTEIEIIPENVLAKTSRQIRGQCQAGEEIYPCPLFWEPKFLLGPYRAQAELSIGNLQGDKITQNFTFFAFPFKLITAILTGIILLSMIKTKIFKK